MSQPQDSQYRAPAATHQGAQCPCAQFTEGVPPDFHRCGFCGHDEAFHERGCRSDVTPASRDALLTRAQTR